MISGHGGDIYEAALQLGCQPTEIVDMSSNINPLGPMPELTEHLRSRLEAITRLPDVDAGGIVELFAARHRLEPKNVLAGNGTTQFIYSLPQALAAKNALILGPTYADYADACGRHQLKIEHQLSEKQNGFTPDLEMLDRNADRFDTVFICNPNNPTGGLIPREKIATLCRRHPGTCFVIDESYLPFVAEYHRHSMIYEPPENVVVLQSLSKIFRVPGLRVGFLIAADSLVNRFRSWMLPWNVNGLAQEAVTFLMQHRSAVDEFVKRSSDYVRREREKLIHALIKRTQAKLYPSETVFFLVELPAAKTASGIKTALLQNRLLIRDCSNITGLSKQHIRVSIKTDEFNRQLAERLVELLNR